MYAKKGDIFQAFSENKHKSFKFGLVENDEYDVDNFLQVFRKHGRGKLWSNVFVHDVNIIRRIDKDGRKLAILTEEEFKEYSEEYYRKGVFFNRPLAKNFRFAEENEDYDY